MKRPVLHSAYVPWREDVGQDPGGPSMTRQDMADECDINLIMARYPGGIPPGAVISEPVYLDLTQSPASLMEAMNTMKDAEMAFMRLPADIRRTFDNNPMLFVEYASDPENLDQMRLWELAAPLPAEPPPVKVEITNSPKAEPPAK